MMRCIIDTDVIVAAIRSRKGASAALLTHVINRDATMFLSVALALEYETIALLPEHVLASGKSMVQIRTLVDTLIEIAKPVKINFQYRPQLSDPGDEMVLETAINSHAQVIISFNKKDYRKEGKIIPNIFGIEVINPGEALQRLRTK